MPVNPAHRREHYDNGPYVEARETVRQRAGGRCERCGLADGTEGWRLPAPDSRFIAKDQVDALSLRDMEKLERVKKRRAAKGLPAITVTHLQQAHLDQDCTNNAIENLALLCGSCHNKHDGKQHRINVRATRKKKRASGTISFLPQLGIAEDTHWPPTRPEASHG